MQLPLHPLAHINHVFTGGHGYPDTQARLAINVVDLVGHLHVGPGDGGDVRQANQAPFTGTDQHIANLMHRLEVTTGTEAQVVGPHLHVAGVYHHIL